MIAGAIWVTKKLAKEIQRIRDISLSETGRDYRVEGDSVLERDVVEDRNSVGEAAAAGVHGDEGVEEEDGGGRARREKVEGFEDDGVKGCAMTEVVGSTGDGEEMGYGEGEERVCFHALWTQSCNF